MKTLDKTEQLTLVEYHQLIEAGILHEDERIELWDGRLYEMSPVGAKHSGMVKRVDRWFTKVFDEQYLVHVQDPIVLPDNTQPQPDVTLLRWREDTYFESLPTYQDVLLLVEVSDSTLAYDLSIKVPRYPEVGIPEVWVIDVNALTLTHFHTPENGVYTIAKTYHAKDTIAVLGVTFPLTDILRG